MVRPRFDMRRWWMVMFCVLLAAGLTAGVIALSLERGRLATYPRVDDVIYMARGAELVRAASDGRAAHGLWGAVRGVWENWRADPPHSPWSSVCAAMGYAFFGFEDWAAYVGTALPVLVFLLAAARLGRFAGGRLNWRALVLVVFAASAPFLAASVHNLKPDYCAGILGAIGMMVVLRGPMLWASYRRLVWCGAWFGLALLAKPSMMVSTGLLAAGTLGICALRDVVLARSPRCLVSMGARVLRACVVVLGVAALTALPHFALAIGHEWAYTVYVLADGEKWTYPGTLAQRALYYLTGPGGRLMLGGLRGLIPVGVLLGGYAAMCCWSGGHVSFLRRRRAVYFGAMLAAVLMAWAGPTATPAKISQYAAAFCALFWLVGVYAAASAASRGRSLAGFAGIALLAALAAAALWRPTFPLMPAEASDPVRAVIEDRTSLVEDVYEQVRRAAVGRGGESRAVSVIVAGSQSDLGAPLLTLWSIRDGLRLNVREVRRVPEPDARDPSQTMEAIALRTLGTADIVIVGEYGTGISKPKHETEGADAYYVVIARMHPGLERFAQVVEARTGKVMEVYRRKVTEPGATPR